MTSICKLKNGNFYFIQKLDTLDECFVDALGGLVSVVATNVLIEIRCAPNNPYEDIGISQMYGDSVKPITPKRHYKI